MRQAVAENSSHRPKRSRRPRHRHRPPGGYHGARARRGGGVVAWLALVVSLLALAGGGYLVYFGYPGFQQLSGAPGEGVEHRLEAIERQLTAQDELRTEAQRLRQQLAQSEDDFGARLRQLRAEVEAQRGALGEQRNAEAARAEAALREVGALAESVTALRAEVGRSVDAWGLREVEQLLVIAGQRLRLTGDIQLATDALTLAETRLRELPDPELATVRRLLAAEITALERVEVVDVVATLDALAALANDADALPLAGDDSDGGNDNDNNDNAPTPPAAPSSSWWNAGKTLLADLGALVQVDTEGKPLAPLLSAELRLMIYEKTQLMLESAQLALVRERNDVYAARMGAARDWVRAQFDTESDAVRAWLARLDALAAVAPAAELPDISASLHALQEARRRGN